MGFKAWAREEVVSQGQYAAGIAPLLVEGYRSSKVVIVIFDIHQQELVLC